MLLTPGNDFPTQSEIAGIQSNPPSATIEAACSGVSPNFR